MLRTNIFHFNFNFSSLKNLNSTNSFPKNSQTRSIYTSNRLRRVLFNVPGSDERKIQKTTQLNLDCVVLDLEDGVAINQKDAARSLIKSSLQKLKFGRAERLIRINSIGSGLEDEDLKNCVQEVATLGLIDSILIPKVESASHIEQVSQFLNSKCGEHGKKVKILAAIESAKGLIDLKDICNSKASTEKLEALIFASEDLSANMGMTRTPEAKELAFARSWIVTHAVAYELQAIDMVCLDYKDSNILSKETNEARQMGYSGKQAIHPNQILPIYESFKPTEKELDLAKRIVEGNQNYQSQGKGAFSIDGKMIDMPLVKWANKIIQRNQQ